MLNAALSFKTIKNKIEDFSPDAILLCVDFDGTLARIQKNPYAAHLENNRLDEIKKISGIKNIYFCIVTGRSISDISKRVGLFKNIVYSGNHGFEIKSYYEDMDLNFIAGGLKHKTYEKILEKIEKDLRKIEIAGLIIENKKYSISLHFRMLKMEETKKLKKETKEIFNSDIQYKKLLQLKRGKKILEVRPKIDWNKGSACEYITERLAGIKYSANIRQGKDKANFSLKILRFNIGDDLTDETMFAKKEYVINNYGTNEGSADKSILKNDPRRNPCFGSFIKNDNTDTGGSKDPSATVLSISCVVGKKKSLADYYIDDYTQTYPLIEKISGLFSS